MTKQDGWMILVGCALGFGIWSLGVVFGRQVEAALSLRPPPAALPQQTLMECHPLPIYADPAMNNVTPTPGAGGWKPEKRKPK